MGKSAELDGRGECGRISDVAQEVGLRFPTLSDGTVEKVKALLPEYATPQNPFDGTGALYDYPEAFPAAVNALLDEEFDVFLPNINALPPYANGRAPSRDFSKHVAEAVKARAYQGLVVAYGSKTLGVLDRETIDDLLEAGIPYLESTEKALRAVASLASYKDFLAQGPRTELESEQRHVEVPDRTGVLGFMQARALLESFGFPVVETRLCRSADEAAVAAEALGFPVALKIESPDVVHKTDAGGVRLGCASQVEVREVYEAILDSIKSHHPRAPIEGVLVQPMAPAGVETILGVKHDPLVGPAVLLGLGGIFTEILRDVSLRIPPLEERDAQAMISDLRGKALLQGARGRPASDVPALAHTVLQLAELALALEDRLVALDLNPLLVMPEGQGVLALDALIELR